MVLSKSTRLNIRLWLWLFLVTLPMFSCVPPCPSVFNTKQGLHRHETVCLTFSTVRALKIERRREAQFNQRPSKRARTENVRLVLSFICRESLTDSSQAEPSSSVGVLPLPEPLLHPEPPPPNPASVFGLRSTLAQRAETS